MKLCNTVILAASIVASNAFAPSMRPSKTAFASQRLQMSTEAEREKGASLFFAESAKVEELSDPYQLLGIQKDALAIGIDPSELLKWVGT
jgi:hypothetical protein